jgi:hypothetical protein
MRSFFFVSNEGGTKKSQGHMQQTMQDLLVNILDIFPVGFFISAGTFLKAVAKTSKEDI